MMKYFMKKVYEALNIEQSGVTWDTVVWNRVLSVPRHKFIFWLSVQEKLQTTRLAQYGVSLNDLCLMWGI